MWVMKHPTIEAHSLQGIEPLTIGTTPTAGTIHDYWRWAYSDLIDNAYRGKGIEVKSCAYHQAWARKKMSRLTYNMRASQSWDPKTNLVDNTVCRRADV